MTTGYLKSDVVTTIKTFRSIIVDRPDNLKRPVKAGRLFLWYKDYYICSLNLKQFIMTNPLLGKSVTIRKGGRTRKISQYAWNLTSDKKGWEEVGKSTDNTAPTPGPRTISTKANKFKTPMATTSFIPDEIANTKTIADKPVISTEEEAKELEKPVIKPLGGNNSENPNPAIPVAPVIPPLTGSGEKQAPGKHTAHKPEQKVPNTGKGKGA